LFNKDLADPLPPHGPGNHHEVHLKEGEKPTWGPLYSMSGAELGTCKEWREEDMSKGFIRQSSSPFAAPGLIANTPDGGLRFGINY